MLTTLNLKIWLNEVERKNAYEKSLVNAENYLSKNTFCRINFKSS